jgi:plastocyanin
VAGRTPVATVLLAFAITIVVAGCATGSRAADPATPVATSRVDLPPSYRFAPAAITVAAGTTVTWTNDDHFTHSVQLLNGGLAAEPQVMAPGAFVSFTFSTPGTYHYQCHLHPGDMQGSVTVTP